MKIVDGLLYVNGRAFANLTFPRSTKTCAPTLKLWCRAMPTSYSAIIATCSNDSRDFGPVDEDFIYGKAVFGYWPFAKLGKLR